MTRKDFELIARVFNKNMNDKTIDNHKFSGPELVRAMACQMAAVLKTTNPLFDHERFLKACGVDEAAYVNNKGKTVNY
jgi:hypothetical protein